MHTITTNPQARLGATLDHRTGRSSNGGPAQAYRRVGRAPTRPNYAARRLGALSGVLVSALLLFQAFGAATSFFGASPALAGGSAEVRAAAPESSTHVARAGDSLWSIAEQHRGSINRSAYIESLIELNGGTAILAGQAVLLP